MKRFYFMAILILIIISGCKSTDTTNLQLEESRSSNNEEKENTNLISEEWNIITYYENNVIYYIQEHDGENISYSYFDYNLVKNESVSIGSITNPFIDTGCQVKILQEFFFYMSRYNQEGTLVSCLYKIDIDKKKLIELYEEELYQTLVYIENIENTIYSFKGQQESGEMYTYVDCSDISGNIINRHFLKYDVNESVIMSIDTFQKEIYVLLLSENKWEILVFDEFGSEIERYDAFTIFDKLGNEYISKFEVSNEYIFVRNLSGNSAVLKLDMNEVNIVISSDITFDIVDSQKWVNNQDFLLYSRELDVLWRVNTLNGNVTKLIINDDHIFENIRYVMCNENGDLFISGRKKGEEVFMMTDQASIDLKEEMIPIDDIILLR